MKPEQKIADVMSCAPLPRRMPPGPLPAEASITARPFDLASSVYSTEEIPVDAVLVRHVGSRRARRFGIEESDEEEPARWWRGGGDTP